jgi:hypothetical protein
MPIIVPPWGNDVVDFFITAIGNLRKDAHHGDVIGRNDMFIWQTLGILPYSTHTIDNIGASKT